MTFQAAKAGLLRSRRDRQQGFTLIELMVVVAIVAILSVIAISSYDWAVMKSRRKAAEGCLQQGAQYMDRWYATNLRYDKTVDGATAVSSANVVAGCTSDVTNFYTVALSASSTTTYTLKATPGTLQASKDKQCGILALDQTGKQYYKTSTADTSGVCW